MPISVTLNTTSHDLGYPLTFNTKPPPIIVSTVFELASNLNQGLINYTNASEKSNSTNVQWVDILTRVDIRILFSLLYIIIFLFGLFGNTLIIYVVCKNKSLQRTVTNIFIANLAVSDIMMSVLCVPFTPLYSFIGSWVFGRVLCRLVSMTQCMSVYLSTLTLTVIAYDRYRVILYPFIPRMSFRGSIYRICLIWIGSTVISLPLAWFQKVVEYPDDHTQYCEEFWPSPKLRIGYSSFNIVAQFIFPLISIAYFYQRVSKFMGEKTKMDLHGFKKKGERRDIKRKKKLNIMLITMITLFSLCWLPLNFVIIFFDIHNELIWWKYYTLVFFISHLTAMSSACHNPILYAWFNSNFRQEFKRILPCFNNVMDHVGSLKNGEMLNKKALVVDLMTNIAKDDDDDENEYSFMNKPSGERNKIFKSFLNRAPNASKHNGNIMTNLFNQCNYSRGVDNGLTKDENRVKYAPIHYKIDSNKNLKNFRTSHSFDLIKKDISNTEINSKELLQIYSRSNPFYRKSFWTSITRKHSNISNANIKVQPKKGSHVADTAGGKKVSLEGQTTEFTTSQSPKIKFIDSEDEKENNLVQKRCFSLQNCDPQYNIIRPRVKTMESKFIKQSTSPTNIFLVPKMEKDPIEANSELSNPKKIIRKKDQESGLDEYDNLDSKIKLQAEVKIMTSTHFPIYALVKDKNSEDNNAYVSPSLIYTLSKVESNTDVPKCQNSNERSLILKNNFCQNISSPSSRSVTKYFSEDISNESSFPESYIPNTELNPHNFIKFNLYKI